MADDGLQLLNNKPLSLSSLSVNFKMKDDGRKKQSPCISQLFMINYTTSNSESDLLGILELQKANLAKELPLEEIKSQGFVTVKHCYDELNNLNLIEKHVIAKDDETVIAYILAMTKQSKQDIPVLVPMFNMFNEIYFNGKLVSAYNYMVVGQVCIAKQYRGQGLFTSCYEAYKNRFRHKYDFAITEIATANQRSINAHKRIGFQEIKRFVADDKTEWSIVLWNWGENI